MIDDTLLQEEVEVPTPTAGGYDGEVRQGPLRIQGDHGPVAIRGVRVKSRENVRRPRPTGRSIFDGATLEGWKISDNDVRGSRRERRDRRLRQRQPPLQPARRLQKLRSCAPSSASTAVATLECTSARKYGPNWPAGYEAQINSTHARFGQDGFALPPTRSSKHSSSGRTLWFDYHLLCKRRARGHVHVVIRVNGVLVNDFVDKDRHHAMRSRRVPTAPRRQRRTRRRTLEVRELR
jgi:hypothetical protein